MARKMKILLFALGILLFISAIVFAFITGFNFKFLLLCGGSCVLILYGLFFEKLIKKKWLTYSILSLCMCFIAMVVFLGVYGRTDNVTYNEDAVVVLGAGIRGEGVTRLLAYRLLKAIEFSENNPDAYIVVSGGQGPDEVISEALAMERYLIRRGVPPERIIKEDASTSTYENFLYSKEILDDLLEGPYEVAVITNDFHIFRAVRVAGKLGLTASHFHAQTDWDSVPLNYTRECLAIIKFLIIGK